MPPQARSRLWTFFLGIVTGFALLAACVPGDPLTILPDTPHPGEGAAPPLDDSGEAPGQSPETSPPGQREDRLVPAIPTQVERVIPPDETPVTGEVPADLLDAVVTDLEGRLQVDRGQFVILRAEEVLWPDGSLGCPQPGQVYTQAQVEGYWIILQAGSLEYDYRLTRQGYFLLCEGVR